ncbi:MAG: large-conductance mechanosensitive channel protein MscL [Clostridia bacterium]|nr:large-conductance mechanosensitive channel protein MscL [Clostridia bacterium]
MKKLLKEFKAFAIKGNVVDLATAVIIGGAFGKIVSSLVGDIIMPLIGLISGSGDFSKWKILLRPEISNSLGDIITPPLFLNSGLFIQHIVDFIIIAGSIFLMIKVLLGAKKKFKKEELEEPKKEEPKLSTEAKLLEEIKEILKEQNKKG